MDHIITNKAISVKAFLHAEKPEFHIKNSYTVHHDSSYSYLNIIYSLVEYNTDIRIASYIAILNPTIANLYRSLQQHGLNFIPYIPLQLSIVLRALP